MVSAASIVPSPGGTLSDVACSESSTPDSPTSTRAFISDSASSGSSSKNLSNLPSTITPITEPVAGSVQPSPPTSPLTPTHSTPAWVGSKFSQLRSFLNLREDDFAPNDGTRPRRIYPHKDDVIFASFDCEAYEDGRDKVTEVGVSFLDMRNTIMVAPGPNGQNWINLMEHRHFVIEEHQHLVNTKQLHGCPDKFNFGKTEMIKKADAKDVLQQVFTVLEPFEERVPRRIEDGEQDEEHEIPDDLPEHLRYVTSEGQRYRKIVLIGHSIADDVKYLSLLGFDIIAHIQSQERHNWTLEEVCHERADAPKPACPYPIDFFDTHTLVQELGIVLSVGKMAHLFGLEPRNLHNAGNDAAYTLQSMVALAFRCHEVFTIPYWPRELLTFKQARKRDEKERAEKAWPVRTVLNGMDNAVYVYKILSTPRRMMRVLKACKKSIAGIFGRWTKNTGDAAENSGSESSKGKGKAPVRDSSSSSQSGSGVGESTGTEIPSTKARKVKTEAQRMADARRAKNRRDRKKAEKLAKKDEEGNDELGGAFFAGAAKGQKPKFT